MGSGVDCPVTFAYPEREHQSLRGPIEQAVLDVLRSGRYILGPSVQRFEQALCGYVGARHAVAVSSGTDALVCSLLALNVGQGDEVIVPAFGFVAGAEAVVRVGARPVFVDIEPRTLGPEPAAVQSSVTSRTKAIVVMHLFGQAVDVEPLQRAAPGVVLIEDAAQAIGTHVQEAHVASRATLATLSFFPAKSLGAAGDAGAVLTNDASMDRRLRVCRVHGAASPYRWDHVGGNYRMDALQAAILTGKLEALPARLERRRQMGGELRALVSRFGVQVFDGCDGCEPTFSPFVIRLLPRDQLRDGLRKSGIDARVQYPITIVSSPCFSSYARVVHDACAGASFVHAVQATEQLLSIPCSPEFRLDEWKHLLGTVRELLEQCAEPTTK